ncbi:hypothetical protein D3C74_207960 [compost metagenome]
MEIFTIRYPLNIKFVVSMLLLTLLWSFQLINNDGKLPYEIIGIVVCIVALITVVVRRFFIKPRVIQFDYETLIIAGRGLEAGDIDKIYIDGSNSIGLKPLNRRIVPISLCFEFVDSHNGLNSLLEWAERNNIEIRKQTFIRWI